MEIIVLSMKGATERQRSMEQQLTRLKLPYRMMEATDARQLTEAELAEWCDLETCRERGFPIGGIGCAISHLRAFRLIAEERIPTALVLEDDAQISDHLPELLRRIEQELMDNEMLLLHGLPTNGCQISTHNEVPIGRGHTIRYPMSTTHFWSALAMAFRLPVAERMAQMMFPIHTRGDWFEAFLDEGGYDVLRCVWPPPINPKVEFPSQIRIRSEDRGLLRKPLNFIYEHRVFPFYQALAWNRRRVRNLDDQQFSLTAEPSPLEAGGARGVPPSL